jgi:hypothetical protein
MTKKSVVSFVAYLERLAVMPRIPLAELGSNLQGNPKGCKCVYAFYRTDGILLIA